MSNKIGKKTNYTPPLKTNILNPQISAWGRCSTPFPFVGVYIIYGGCAK